MKVLKTTIYLGFCALLMMGAQCGGEQPITQDSEDSDIYSTPMEHEDEGARNTIPNQDEWQENDQFEDESRRDNTGQPAPDYSNPSGN